MAHSSTPDLNEEATEEIVRQAIQEEIALENYEFVFDAAQPPTREGDVADNDGNWWRIKRVVIELEPANPPA